MASNLKYIGNDMAAGPIGGGKLPPPMKVDVSAKPLRIAIVYSRNPLPMRRADQMTVAHLIAFLKARGHFVDLYNVGTGGDPDEVEHTWLRERCASIATFAHRPLDACRAALLSLTGLPVQVGLFSNGRQRRALMGAVDAGRYDLVYTYYFRSAEISKEIARRGDSATRPATFLAMQLSQTLNTSRIAKNAPNIANRLFYSFESKLVERYEAKIWRFFDRVVLIGKNDAQAINETSRKLGGPNLDNVVFCAHGVDTERFRPRDDLDEVPGKLVFSGVMRTPTNVQAVQWFVGKVWPLIRAQVPEATFDIVGREPSSEVLALSEVPGVTVVGTVPDTSVPIATASLCINSMQAGGGMQNKLIEYLGSAKAVVATSVANEGIGARSGEHLVIADKPEDFAKEVVGLLRDPERRRALGQAARQFILNEWTWEAHFLKLENAFHEAVEERGACGASR